MTFFKYSREKLLDVLKRIDLNIDDPNGSERELDALVEEFEELSEHPKGSDLLFYPTLEIGDSQEAIVSEVERWRKENSLSI